MELAIVGCGNMGGALLKGALSSNLHGTDEVLVYHPRPKRAEEIATEYGVIGTSDPDELAGVPRLLVGVKPAMIEASLAEFAGVLEPGQLVISIAAGITLDALQQAVGRDDVAVIRAMPNTPAQVGAGITTWCASDNTSAGQRDYAECFFSAVGVSEEVAETMINPLTALCGSGPAYILMVIEALADAAVHEGVPRRQAEPLAAAMVQGTAKMARLAEKSAAVLRTEVTSPGGTTAAGCARLEYHGLRAAFLDCLAAANKRAEELGG